jgi:uncharacterized protein (UPF0332 family)
MIRVRILRQAQDRLGGTRRGRDTKTGTDPVKKLEIARLNQARESLNEAQALLANGMDTGFVLTNLFYAFYYPILALMNEGQVPTSMQSVTLGLFEQQFIKTGLFKKEYSSVIYRLFILKPKCSGEKTTVNADEVNTLLDRAREFIDDAEEYCKILTDRWDRRSI